MSSYVIQELVAPDFAGPAGCRVCRGPLDADGEHAAPPAWPHAPAPAWETVGYTTAGLAVVSAIPRWREVVVDDWDGDDDDGWDDQSVI